MNRTPILCGLGAWVPPTVVTNNELAQRLDTTDDWIRTRTGIHQRHIIEPGMATSDLAVEAGSRALKSSGDSTVDVVVLATTTPDHPIPATAPTVAARLGLNGVAAFDLNAVCSGFIYGLAAAAALITASMADRVLFIGADTFSTTVNQDDRSIAPLFGDGAGAVVLRAGTADEPGALTTFDLGSDGTRAELIRQAAGGSRQRSTQQDPLVEADHYLAMNGTAVFTTAVTTMAASSRAVLERGGYSADDVNWLVAHQANARILHAVGHQLDIPTDRLITNIDQVGNTAAASIPLALAHATRTGSLQVGQLILLTAFGGGLTWGSALLHWPDLTTN